MTRFALTCLLLAVHALPAGTQPAPQLPPGITRVVLADNASALIARLHLAPGAREEIHTHPFSAVVVQITPGRVEMNLDGRVTTGMRDAGSIDFLPKEVKHAAANVGTSPIEVVTVALKPGRTPAGALAAVAFPREITRTVLLDNDEARVARVRFSPSGREPVHTHAFDLVIVQLTPGQVEVEMGGRKEARRYAAGDVTFVPRDVPHAFASVDTQPFELVSVSVK